LDVGSPRRAAEHRRRVIRPRTPATRTRAKTTKTIQQAVADLERDPDHVVTAEVNGLILEIRCTGRRTADDVFREVGPWEGEPAEELRNLLDQARKAGGFKEPPAF